LRLFTTKISFQKKILFLGCTAWVDRNLKLYDHA
jgi:hypothetical protein